jgi:mono/diheme cytochrome c family protein
MTACTPRIFAPGWRAGLVLVCIALLGFAARVLNAAVATPKDGAGKVSPVSFHREILPTLQAHCQGCHQPAKAGGKLDLTAFKNLLGEGESGLVAIVPGKPGESNLLEQITPQNGEAAMPKEQKPLADSEVALFRRWIEEGAKDDTPASTAPPVDAEHPPVYNAPPVITSIDWSPDGSLLAVAGFHEVLLHKADGSGLVARLVGMSPRIESIRFSPDGTKLAVTGGRPAQMGEVQIWSVADHQLLLSKPVSNDVLFGASWSPDGKRVAFGGTD